MAVVTVCIMPVRVMAMRRLEPGLAMEHQEVHPERVEGRDEHAREQRPVGNARARHVGVVKPCLSSSISILPAIANLSTIDSRDKNNGP